MAEGDYALASPILPNRQRLGFCLEVARQTISLDLGTFWCEQRDGEAAIGCLIGRYIKARKTRRLQLVPLNFLEQLKAPVVAEQELGEHPNEAWRHYTIHYTGMDAEAWGLTAAMLYFGLRAWDAQTLFWPAGYDGARYVESSTMADRLYRFLITDRALRPQ